MLTSHIDFNFYVCSRSDDCHARNGSNEGQMYLFARLVAYAAFRQRISMITVPEMGLTRDKHIKSFI